MNLKLSPSTLNLFIECPRCFWNHFHGRKRPDTIFPSLPSGMDKVLKEYFDYYRKRKLAPVEIEATGAKLYSGPELRQWQNNFKGISWTDPKTKAVLRGAVDELLIKGSKLIVLDFKTRGFPLKADTHEHYQLQLDVYNFLLRKNHRQTENYSYLLFFHPTKACRGKQCYFFFDYTLKQMKVNPAHAEEVFHDAVKCLEKSSPPKASKDCGFCKYQK